MVRSEETIATFSNSVPSNDLAGKSLPNCPMRVELNCLHIKVAREKRGWALSLDQKILKADNTSFEEDLNRLDMLALMSMIKGLPTLS